MKNSKKIKLIKKGKDLNNVKNIGQRIAESVSVFFEKKGTDDPTKNFNWEYILIDNKKIEKCLVYARWKNCCLFGEF